MKGEEGEANGMKRSQIKWKLLLFDESDFFFFLGQFIFYSLLIGPRYLFSRKSRNVTVLKKHTKTQIIRWSGLNRTYNLSINI